MALSLKELVTFAQAPSPWDLGNEMLYALCRRYSAHDLTQAVIAKVWLIGRTYAVAIERRRKFRRIKNDEFYVKTVAPKIRGSPIDRWIARAACFAGVDTDSLPEILEVHAEVTNLFQEISGLEKRSLASKYLHFHLPDHFFIYDARAVQAMHQFNLKIGRVRARRSEDHEYARFAQKCLQLQARVHAECNIELSPRQLDNLLLKAHADGPRR